MFAGSILDLEPDTAYEARFVLTDPDGVSGPAANATRTVTVRTRPEPRPAEGGKVYHVYPVGHTGPKTEPAFTGIMCAYNYYCGAGDTAPGGRPRVKPGDIILVHAGTYAYRYELYANQTTINATTTFEGTYYLTADGTPEKPIVIKAAGDGEVIIDGRGNFNLFNVKAADYNYFEGITFRNTDIAIWAGTQFIAGSKGLTVKRCRFEQVGMGVFSNYSGSSNFYIADSVFLGRNDSKHLTGWNGAFWEQFNGVEGQAFPPIMASYTAIRLYGPGHVVAHNYVADFHDGIDTEMYGMPDGSHANEGPEYPPREYWDRRPVAIDIYNNYITNAHDNSIEMDGSMHNIRLMRNVLINSASHPMSTQPSVGGPIYWIRNIVYHAPGGSTRMTAGSPGVLFYHNTVTTETSAGVVGERALAQQPDARPGHRAGDLQRDDQHRLQLVGLQRLPAESRRRGVVPMECGGRAAGAPAPPRRRVCDAGGIRQGDAAGSEQRHARLRRVRERAEARSRSEDRAAPLRLQGLRLPPEAGLGGDRSRRGAAEHQRRLHRERRRTSARSKPGSRCRSTVRGAKEQTAHVLSSRRGLRARLHKRSGASANRPRSRRPSTRPVGRYAAEHLKHGGPALGSGSAIVAAQRCVEESTPCDVDIARSAAESSASASDNRTWRAARRAAGDSLRYEVICCLHH